MFNFSQWGWVFFAWGQLVITYIAYQLYLLWRLKKLEEN